MATVNLSEIIAENEPIRYVTISQHVNLANTGYAPAAIVLAVATKWHCSHSLKTRISVQIKAGLGEDAVWLGWMGLAFWVT